MTDQTGNALLARIKELEEALEGMLKLIDEVYDYPEMESAVKIAKKALSK